MRSLLIVIGLIAVLSMVAVPDAQADRLFAELTPLEFGAERPLTGRLDSAAPQAAYTFACFQGQVASVIVETTAGNLAVDITVYDPNEVLMAVGGIRMGTSVSVAEAFVMSSDGQCTIELTRAGETAGAFALRLLPGYAKLDKWDAFDGAHTPLRLEWPPFLSDAMEIDIHNQQLEITVMAAETFGFILPEDPVRWGDFFVQADFEIEGAPTYYEYGFMLRSNTVGDAFYTLMVSADGDWVDYYFDDGWFTLQPWVVSPTINGAAQNVKLGVWMQGNTARLYFNHRYVGEVSDPNWSADQGTIGFSVGTGVGQRDWLTITVDNLIITRPYGS